MSAIRDCFASNLRALRKANGLTQEALAERIGMTSTHVAHLETKRTWPSADAVTALAAALGADETALFRPTEGESPLIASILGELSALDDDKLRAVLSLVRAFRATPSVTQPQPIRDKKG